MLVTKIGKVILGIMAVIALLIAVTVTYMVNAIEEAGGMKAVIIEVGKDIKDMSEQINKDS